MEGRGSYALVLSPSFLDLLFDPENVIVAGDFYLLISIFAADLSISILLRYLDHSENVRVFLVTCPVNVCVFCYRSFYDDLYRATDYLRNPAGIHADLPSAPCFHSQSHWIPSIQTAALQKNQRHDTIGRSRCLRPATSSSLGCRENTRAVPTVHPAGGAAGRTEAAEGDERDTPQNAAAAAAEAARVENGPMRSASRGSCHKRWPSLSVETVDGGNCCAAPSVDSPAEQLLRPEIDFVDPHRPIHRNQIQVNSC